MSETIENTLEPGKRKKFSFALLTKRILIILGILVLIGAIYYAGSYYVWKSRLRLYIEDRIMQSEVLKIYSTGTLDECIEKIQNAIHYYETNRLKFETPHYRVEKFYISSHEGAFYEIDPGIVDVNLRICNLRLMLGYCFLCAGEPVKAYNNILFFYEGSSRKFPRNQMMQKLIAVEEHHNANWKADHPIDTNVFCAVDDMFRTNAPATEKFLPEKGLKNDSSNE